MATKATSTKTKAAAPAATGLEDSTTAPGDPTAETKNEPKVENSSTLNNNNHQGHKKRKNIVFVALDKLVAYQKWECEKQQLTNDALTIYRLIQATNLKLKLIKERQIIFETKRKILR
jgi:hypothetical protein